VITLVLASCSTEKNTLVTRGYHNLTAHYNVYFNGKEAMKSGLEKIDEQVEEDYTKILPVFKESLPGTADLVSSDMDIAIDKGTKLIKFHSITTPPESTKKRRGRRGNRDNIKPEYNKWVDDAYIMIGRAYLYKKEFIQASSIFQLIIRKYKNQPVKYEAYIWLIRSLSEAGRYTEARKIVETLEGDDLFPEKLEGELAIVAADMHMKQHQYDEAIHYLDIGINNIRGNKRKTRYTYILAQLYQETGNQEQALEAYQQVIRRRPNYKMLFNARINSAGVFSGEGNAAMLRKELNKMRRKKWNKPFLDQIYFALGNLAYNEGKTDEAVKMYRKSVASSYDNSFQLALSAMTLADLYLEQREYILSGKYYDSAMVVIDENYPNYDAISKKYATLSALAGNLETVETEDSLQALAKLPEDELNEKIDKWVEIEKEKQKELMEGDAGGAGGMNYYRATSSRMRLGGNTSGWYFYNQTTVSYGKKEFQQLWGNRENEDNWRRSNKSEAMYDESGEPIEGELTELMEEEVEQRNDDPTTREYYMQDIPLTDSMLAASHTKIRDALFNAGVSLKSEFNDYETAITCFAGLNERYPDNIYQLSGWFYLWDSYNVTNKPDSAAYYKNLIIENYPGSNYAKYLINPNFFIEEESRKDSINKLYSQAFVAYKNRDYKEATRLTKTALTLEPDTALMPKIQFVRVISESRNLGNNRLADSLRAYIEKYKGSEPVQFARQILGLVNEDRLSDYDEMVKSGYLNDKITNKEVLQQQNADDPYGGKWDTDSDLLHYFIIAIPADNDIDVNRLKFDIANYNLDHYTMLDFDIETETLNNDTRLIIVRNFENKQSALVYFLSIIRKPEVFKTLAGKKYYNFVASNNNYREMLSDRSYDQYLAYFSGNYSSMVSGKFSESELESPEELMARLNKDPNDELKEKGEFVVVKAADETGSGEGAAVERIFDEGYDTPHSFMIVIEQENFGTGFLMRDFVRYNLSEIKDRRFRVLPGQTAGKTLLTVSSFTNAIEAQEYMKTVNDNPALLESIGDIDFQAFIISDSNLKKLLDTGKMDEWKRFYRANYIYRKPQLPEKKAPATVKNETEDETVVPSQKETPVPEEKQEEAVAVSGPEAESETISPEEPANVQPGISPEEAPVDNDVETRAGLFEFDAEAGHNLVYILPANGSNQTLLITYLTRFNAISNRGSDIEVTTKPFDDFRTLVMVTGLGSKEKAEAYFEKVKNDPRVNMSLRNIEYRSFLITGKNTEALIESKAIQGYQKFYNEHY
jgi:tetratricopeptide (TPR) repeat protein